MEKHTLEQFKAAFKSKGYKFFTGRYNINLFGIRSANQQSDSFDDKVGMIYQNEHDETIILEFDATTDPGLYWMLHPIVKKGTAIMLPGQYRGAYQIGRHRNYIGFRQIKEMAYVRDNNKDSILDFNLMNDPTKVIWAIIYSNIHRTNDRGIKSTLVGKWSAACQVLADSDDFDVMLEVAQTAIDDYGFANSFTYTLFEEADVNISV